MDKLQQTFRLACNDDLGDINRIYNQAIEHRNQTADLEIMTVSETEIWFEAHQIEKYPIFVIDVDGDVVGWSSLSAYRKGRQALEHVAEITYYLDQEHQGRGLGKLLMEKTMAEVLNYDFDTLVAILLDSNIPSKGILKRYGFQEWGRIPGAARIEGGHVDHLYFGLRII